jgi:hypothetical protein
MGSAVSLVEVLLVAVGGGEADDAGAGATGAPSDASAEAAPPSMASCGFE